MKQILLCVALAATALAAQGQNDSSAPRKIELTARKFEFSPGRIEVKVGETVEIAATSLDSKHGFECKDLKIEKVTFEPNKPATIRFTASRAGTYQFKCANYCGSGHGRMKGEIVVAP